MSEMKFVYTIIEKEGLDKNQWVKVGVAFVNRDSSLTVRLDALPLNGMLHVRTPKKKAETVPEIREAKAT